MSRLQQQPSTGNYSTWAEIPLELIWLALFRLLLAVLVKMYAPPPPDHKTKDLAGGAGTHHGIDPKVIGRARAVLRVLPKLVGGAP